MLTVFESFKDFKDPLRVQQLRPYRYIKLNQPRLFPPQSQYPVNKEYQGKRKEQPFINVTIFCFGDFITVKLSKRCIDRILIFPEIRPDEYPGNLKSGPGTEYSV